MFWKSIDEILEGEPREKRLVVGADFNGHVGEGSHGDAEVMGKYGFGMRNKAGQSVGLCKES